jgi:outer membrane protein OmpA-like peptidoglycan-associated protein
MQKLFLFLFLLFFKLTICIAQNGCPKGFEGGNNLIANPNFDEGLKGFYSDYNRNYTYNWFQGSINVTNNPNQLHNNYRLCLDTTHKNLDNMLVVDGAEDRNKIVWQQKIKVETGVDYYFSFFFATLLKPNPAQLEITINNIRLSKPFDYNYQHCKGSVYFCFWNSGIAKEADIKIKAYSTELLGNDFALDNFQFFTCKKRIEPETIAPIVQKRDFSIVKAQITSSSAPKTPISIELKFQNDTVSKNIETDSIGIARFTIQQKNALLKIQAKNYFPLFDTIIASTHYTDSLIAKKYQLVPLDSGATFTLKNLTFERYSSELNEQNKLELLPILELLNNNPNIHFAIQGHTDNQGDALKNYELSLDRVKSVKRFLIEKGIEESRLKEIGFGGTKPLVGYGTDEERKVNRRVEFVVTKNR